MRRALLAAVMALSVPAFAQKDDQPIPYGDEEENRELPKKSRRSERIREEDEEAKAGEETLTHLDDPNYGLGGGFLAGAMLFESSRGAGVEPRFMYGFRFTWEWGRLIPDEFLREMFFADVAWQYGAQHEGTVEVNGDTNLHYFTLAPAFCLPFQHKGTVAAYAQLGIGFNYDSSSIRVDKTETQISGTKFLFQYGIGLRGRPAVTADESFRIEWRIEVTRFLRGYMSDTFLGAGVGVVF